MGREAMLKTRLVTDMLATVKAVLEGKQFVSRGPQIAPGPE